MIRTVFLSCLIFLIACSDPNQERIEQWDIYEVTLEGPSTGNPYMENELYGIFKMGDMEAKVPGFYDGEGKYKIRFSPDNTGVWTYQTESNVADLDGITGSFRCIPADSLNHGPVQTVNTYYLQYADGTPFYSVGTTAYQWTSVKQSIQEQTIQTLTEAPFNKIRMCVFPKWYRYGNTTEPWMYPYERKDTVSDFTRPNHAFFQNIDKRVEQLNEMGIQADVIMFHPYDNWGYCEMGDELNERYVRYMIARLSAYRNVWWSLANEWDIPRIKETIDWEGIGQLLQAEDPHQRLRGIHNWYNTEKNFYDHSRPWITHVSAQTAQFYNAVKWRNKYQKPLLFDEMRYEGDVPSGWGNLSSEEMTAYFWMAGLSGGYGTHGDTYQNTADDSTEVRWWAKGGKLVGSSPERIAFFRAVMEEAPVHEMTPGLVVTNDSSDLESNIYQLSKEGAYYLVYNAVSRDSLELELTSDENYTVDVIDTWNMEVIPMEGTYSGRTWVVLPDKPYLAVRAKKLHE